MDNHNMGNESKVGNRGPCVDGIFYPGYKNELLSVLKELTSKIDSPKKSNAGALVVPHAAYDYMGQTAAAVYGRAEDRKIETVVLIGPEHRERTNNIILTKAETFSTPIGPVSVDLETTGKLLALGKNIVQDDIPHYEEHCLEVQLPFIQFFFPEAKIFPVLIGNISKSTAHRFVDSILHIFPGFYESVLVVVTVNSAYAGDTISARQQSETLKGMFIPGNSDIFFDKGTDKNISACGVECLGLLLNPSFGFKSVELTHESQFENSVGHPEKTVIYSGYSLYN